MKLKILEIFLSMLVRIRPDFESMDFTAWILNQRDRYKTEFDHLRMKALNSSNRYDDDLGHKAEEALNLFLIFNSVSHAAPGTIDDVFRRAAEYVRELNDITSEFVAEREPILARLHAEYDEKRNAQRNAGKDPDPDIFNND